MRSALVSCALLALALSVPAQIDPEVTRIVEGLDANVRADAGFSIIVDDTMDVVDEAGRIVQVGHRRQITMLRPDRLHIVSSGDIAEREFVKNGDEVTIIDHGNEIYAEVESPGTVGDTMTFMLERYGIHVPLGDFLAHSPSEVLLGDAREAEYLGERRVDDVVCHHVWIRYDEIDAQLWVDAVEGGRLRKMLIRYENEPGTPQYTLRLVTRFPTAVAREASFEAAVPEGYDLVEVEPLVEAVEADERR